MLKIQLKQAMLDVNINRVTLYFNNVNDYKLACLILKDLDTNEALCGGSYLNVLTPYITIYFNDREVAEQFFRIYVKQELDERPSLYADDGLVCRFEPRVYLYLPEEVEEC